MAFFTKSFRKKHSGQAKKGIPIPEVAFLCC